MDIQKNLKSSHEWFLDDKYKDIKVYDPDGWNRKDYDNSMNEIIDEEEFNKRILKSTIGLIYDKK